VALLYFSEHEWLLGDPASGTQAPGKRAILLCLLTCQCIESLNAKQIDGENRTNFEALAWIKITSGAARIMPVPVSTPGNEWQQTAHEVLCAEDRYRLPSRRFRKPIFPKREIYGQNFHFHY
jgi:hypothetical protein